MHQQRERRAIGSTLTTSRILLLFLISLKNATSGLPIAVFSGAVSHPRLTFATAPSTLVEITLEERAEGTLLTLVESGFASLPQPIPTEEAYRDNQDGWQECLNGLRAYLQSQEVV